MAVHGGGAGDDSEDDDDIIAGVTDDFRKQIDALKRACVLEVGHGGFISTPASILSGESPASEEDEEEEEDDDELLRSIERKYGSLLFGKGASREKKLDVGLAELEEDEEEDDEELLRSVEQLYRGGRSDGQQGLLTGVVPPLKDSSNTETHHCPSPQASPDPGDGTGGDGDLSPQRSCEIGKKPIEEVGRSITSFLPGNWIDTDGDVEFGGASPARPLAMALCQPGHDNLNHVSAKTEHVHIVADALKKNRECQRTLKNILSQLEAKQKENAELQRRVRALVDYEKLCNRRFAGFFTDQANPSVKLIALKAPALQTKLSEASEKAVNVVQTCGPPENSDVDIYKKLQKKVSFTFVSKRWSNEERSELAKGVKQQAYEVLVRQAMDDLSSAETAEEDLDSFDEHMRSIGEKEFTSQEIRNAIPNINWADVARVYVTGRTAEECHIRWINHEDPLINKSPWARTEDKKLLRIAQQENFCKWEKVAQQLATNRIPAECLIRYQRSLNASIMRSNWTPEEDSQLRMAVEEFGEDNWSAVAGCLEGRNNNQCLMRWYKVLHPKKTGRWSVEEDKRLKWAVSVYGPKKWKQIAEHVPGRTDIQVRERWCNVLDPTIKLGSWTAEEDADLEASVAKHGPHHWAAVANDLKIRTDNQCCRRWKTLHPEDLPEFQKTVHIRRTALVGNFQGRKKERPRLGPHDFISNEVFGKKAARKRKLNTEKPREELPESMSVNEPWMRRAARIQKRKLARANQAFNGRIHRPTSVPDVQTGSEVMVVTNPVDLALDHQGQDAIITKLGEKENPPKRKRKAGPSTDSCEPCKRTGKKAKGSNASVTINHSRKTSQDLQPVGPQISSFVDLICCLKTYCTYACLVAKEENWPEFQRKAYASNTQELPECATEANTFDIPVAESNEPLLENGSTRSSSNQNSLEFRVCEDSLELENEDVQEASKCDVDANCRDQACQKQIECDCTDRVELHPLTTIPVAVEPIREETREMMVKNIRNSSLEECSAQEVARRSVSGVSCISHRPFSHQALSTPGSQSLEIRDECSCQSGKLSLNHRNNEVSYKDDEIASATKAVLSWPFFNGVQELLSRGKTYLRSKAPNQNSKKVRDREMGTSPLFSKVVTKPRSARVVKMRGAISWEKTGFFLSQLHRD